MGNIPSAKEALNCERAFRQIAHSSLNSIRRNRSAACRGDVEGIHRMRIAFTRLGAARKFFSAMVTDDDWRVAKLEIRWLNRVLGEARDHDVAFAYAKKLPADSFSHVSRSRIARQVADGHARVERALRSRRYRELLAALRNWIDRGPWMTSTSPTIGELRKTLLERYASRRLKQWSRRFVRWNARPMKASRQHRIRIMAKRYRYMVEALVDLGINRSRTILRQVEAAHELQRALGNLRDLRRTRRKIGVSHDDAFLKRKGKLLKQTRKALDIFS